MNTFKFIPLKEEDYARQLKGCQVIQNKKSPTYRPKSPYTK